MAAITVRKAISEVVNDLRALQVDDHISQRFVLGKLIGFNANFIKKEADMRRLYKSNDIWFTVPCVQMKPAKVTDCCNIDIPFCDSFMKSVKPLPRTYTGNQGNIIRELSSINNTVLFEQVTPRQFQSIAQRQYRSKKKKYYWIENDYIVIPESDVEVVKITAGFIDVYEAKKISSCTQPSPCEGPLDQPFLCSEYLWELVRSETVKDLFNFYKRNQPDFYPDGSPNNVPTTRKQE